MLEFAADSEDGVLIDVERLDLRDRALTRVFALVCAEWMVPEPAEDAELVATELVENTLRYPESAPRLRLELRRKTLSVEVSDESRRPAVLREGLDLVAAGLGLRMITKVAKRWGSSRSRSGGKTVWALLAR